MRIKNSMKNIYISILTQIVMVLLGFISRKVFVDNLGIEYLGINNLLTSLLSMLSLVESGIGASIIYNLYKPLAEDNREKIIALTQLYKKLYTILSLIILCLSIVMYVYLESFIKGGTTVQHIGVVYFVFVAQNIISYLNAHRWSLINADQKGYVVAKCNLVFDIISTLSKIIILRTTKNYILFLIIGLLICTIQNICIGIIVNRRYSYIKTDKKYVIDDKTKENIITNVKAIFLHKIGSYCVFGTDNLLISAFVNISTVGIYSNYSMIIRQLESLIKPLLNGISASVGNLIAKENVSKIYDTFNVVYLINFWIYSLAVIFLYNLLTPFIEWYMGSELLLGNMALIVILINFYITGLRNSINLFKEKAGIFDKDKFMPLLESAINLVASIVLARYYGLIGIFIGTTISSIMIPLWVQSKIVYNDIFNKSVLVYFKKYVYYLVLTIIACWITTYICNLIIIKNTFISLVVKGIICIIIPNIIYVLLLYKTEEFKYLFNLVKSMSNGIKIKIGLTEI